MTTYSHTLVAAVAASESQSLPLEWKVATVGALIVSHLISDLAPHYHFWGFDKWRQTWRGMLFEIVIIPAIIAGVGLLKYNIPFWWLAMCIFSASLPDFVEVAGWRPPVPHHWWDPVNLPQYCRVKTSREFQIAMDTLIAILLTVVFYLVLHAAALTAAALLITYFLILKN